MVSKRLGTAMLGLVAISLVFVPSWSFAEGERQNAEIFITCDSTGVSSITPNPLRIKPGESVNFSDGACDSAVIAGPHPPIGFFILTPDSASQTKGPFAVGKYTYEVTKTGSYNPAVEGVINVVPPVPSLTGWGVLALVLLLAGATLWVIRKKRAGVPA